MIRENIKLFKMNEYDWVGAESAEQANEWYKEEFTLTEEEQPLEDVEEVSLETEFTILFSDLTEKEKEELVFGIMTDNINEVAISFTYILSKMTDEEIQEPFMAGSTEW